MTRAEAMTLADRWPLPGLDDVRDRLLAAYAEPERGYHDQQHLTEVLDRLDELGCSDRTVVVAAWFHDAVYDGDRDDEERSAVLAEESLARDLPEAEVAEVARLVRLTTTHRPADDDLPGQLLCDADLAILAAPPERYADYVRGVRREYAEVADADFRAGRADVLRDLLAKPTLFHTEQARSRWEDAARRNATAELEQLETR